ncbi:hypothetical protein [Acidisarcina polymorpha]|uniref:hypothetical protein n=1 Tax=Acidisarcina polymorpha TaxID=2211140 RepID=UPI000DF0062B|nr:hypothetical protein [Acidisarcina polymorpha]
MKTIFSYGDGVESMAILVRWLDGASVRLAGLMNWVSSQENDCQASRPRGSLHELHTMGLDRGGDMKRKTTQAKQSSTEHSAESPSEPENATQGILYEDARGKTVDFIRCVGPSQGLSAFEIQFTDGTFFFIEPVPRVEFRVRLLKSNRGNVRTIRDYGTIR